MMPPTTCPQCFGGAVVDTARDGMRFRTCSGCGWAVSDTNCSTRTCGKYAVAKCVECNDPFCRAHMTGKQKPLCDRCRRKLRDLVNPPRTRKKVRTWWGQ